MQGCDASILLDANQTTGIQSELESKRNFGIRLMSVIDNIKAEFESTCPGVVSCADIVAMAGRDAISQVRQAYFLRIIVLHHNLWKILNSAQIALTILVLACVKAIHLGVFF